MKAFIFGTVYIENPQRAELVQMWLELNEFLNPEFPLVVIDSFSDPMWRNMALGGRKVEIHTVKEGDPLPPLKPGLNWIDFPENLGHPSIHGVDGWGRAFTRAIELGITQNYDYVINVECDLLFRRKVMDILQEQHDKKIKFITAWERSYGFMENCICFMQTEYLKQIDFIGQYNWRVHQPNRLPELRMEDITMESLYVKPWRGLRDDFAKCQPGHIPHLDYITHAHDMRLYYDFMTGIMPSGWLPPSQRS